MLRDPQKPGVATVAERRAITVAIEVRFFTPGTTFCVDYDMNVLFNGIPPATRFCFGDGSDGVGCPCGNVPAAGSHDGCVNGTGQGAFLTGSGVPSAGSDSYVLTVLQAVPSDFGVFVQNVATTTPLP